MIAGYGTGNSFELYLQDRSGKGIDALSQVTNHFLEEFKQTSRGANGLYLVQCKIPAIPG